MHNNKPVENLGHQASDSKPYDQTNHQVENKTMIEEYTLDTSLENCSLDEKLLECLESPLNGNLAHPNICEKTDHGDVEKCTTDVKRDTNKQFKTPVKSMSHEILPQSTSPLCNNFTAQMQTPSKAVTNTSMDSLVDAVELDNLLDGVEWSPMVSCPENRHISR